jgi:hypothetical protein
MYFEHEELEETGEGYVTCEECGYCGEAAGEDCGVVPGHHVFVIVCPMCGEDVECDS